MPILSNCTLKVGAQAVAAAYFRGQNLIGPVALSQVAIIPFGDSRTAIRHFDAAHKQSSNHSFHNWSNVRHGQPFDYTGNFGIGGQTTVQMQSRITDAIASKRSGKENCITLLCGVNDVGLLLDSAATIWGRVQAFAEEAMAAGVKPIVFSDPGSEAFSSSNVAKMLAYNALAEAWVDSQSAQPSDIRPVFFDYAPTLWAETPTTAISMKPDYTYDGLHNAVVGSYHNGKDFYDFMRSVYGDFEPNEPTGTNLLLNANFATPTGGNVGSGTSGPVPASWRSVRDNANVTSIVFSGDGTNVLVTAEANSSNALNGFKLQQNMIVGDFSPGDVLEAWATVDLLAGAVGVSDISVDISFNYTDSSFETIYADQSSTGGLNNVPSATDQTLRLRSPIATVNPAKTLSAVTYFVRVRFRAAGSCSVRIRDPWLAKI